MPEGGDWKDLFKAAEAGDSAKTRYHLGLGVDPNFQHPEYFTAPLFEAIRNGHLEIVRILIEEGNADPAIIEELTGDTAVDTAVACKRFDILDYISTKLPKQKQHPLRHILITDGNLGKGKEICLELLLKGHKVVFICECEDMANTIKEELCFVSGNSKVDYIVGTLDSVKNVNEIVKEVHRKFPSLNTLIHNKDIWSTQLILNKDGLELSFMINYMAKYVLSKGLMGLLSQNKDSRVVFIAPEFSHKSVEPDLNETPFGKDFHWMRTFSNTVASSFISFMTLVQSTSDSSVAITMFQTKGTCFTTSNPSDGCIAWVLRIAKRFFNDSACIEEMPVWLSQTEMFKKDLHGAVVSSDRKVAAFAVHSPALANETRRKQWEQWTTDFLSRSDTEE